MTANKFSTHDIVIDKDGYEGRIYKVIDLGGDEPSYDVVMNGCHVVRHESELTMVKQYIEDAEWLAFMAQA